MQDKQYIIISPDIFVLYQDGEGCCSSAYSDEVSNVNRELGPVFSIVIPGLEEWCQRYENATDFADTTTDPSFDWRSWHFEGLQFAKAIWQQMPRNYTLIYKPPFEDPTHTIKEFVVDENIDVLIESLGPKSSFHKMPPALQNDIDFSCIRNKDSITVHFKLGRAEYDVTIPFYRLDGLRKWLENLTYCIWHSDKPVNVFQLSGCELTFYKQTIGSHKEMGQFWITEDSDNCPKFSAYVNIRLFVKGFYLSVMNALGFYFYPISLDDDDEYPSGEERVKLWEPYNTLKSVKIESGISNIPVSQSVDANTEPINETFVMFPDYGGCIFWDTMGVGSGVYNELWADSGDIKLNVRGLKEWSEYYDNPEVQQLFEDYWRQGWELALQVRNQLPDNIDLYYMCYDPAHPQDIVGYSCRLLKIIVPRICNLYEGN